MRLSKARVDQHLPAEPSDPFTARTHKRFHLASRTDGQTDRTPQFTINRWTGMPPPTGVPPWRPSVGLAESGNYCADPFLGASKELRRWR